MDLGIIALSVIMAIAPASPPVPASVDTSARQFLQETTFEALSWPILMPVMPVVRRRSD
jgi:hypothetical protein